MKLLETKLSSDVKKIALALAKIMPPGGKWAYDEKPLYNLKIAANRAIPSYSYFMPGSGPSTWIICKIFMSKGFNKPELNPIRVLVNKDFLNSKESPAQSMIEVVNALHHVGKPGYVGESGVWHIWDVLANEA